ncbi:glutamate receptor ionotropic, NMDA 3B-like [Cryptotermes secundus]|nr:glutamate receptor ionotropic, NMDA 3B-like [Cryptotermes secundus]
MSDSHRFLLNKDLFESKVPENLGLCPLRISTSHFPPFVIFPDENNTTLSSMRGVEMDMLRHISEAMNASVVLPHRIDNGTDSKAQNGVWTGPIGDLLYNRSDVALGAWCFTLEDSLVVDGTNSYFTEEFTFFIPRAEMYPLFLSMSRVFAPNVWLLIFVVILLTAVLLNRVALVRSVGESDSYKYITNCLLRVWSVIVGVSVHEMPRSNPLRGVFLLWVVFCLAINTVFQTYVTSYLVDPGFRYQIDSPEEVIESGLDVYVIDFLHAFLSDNLLNQLKSWRKCGSGNQCLMIVSKSPGVVMLSGKVFVEYKADKQNGVIMYHESSHDLFHFHIVMVIKKGSPFLDRMNIIIRRLVEGGFPGKFFKDIIEKENMRSLSELDQYFSMSVYHLQSAFVAMFVGMSLSVLLFFAELMTRLIQRSNQTNSEIV